MLTQLIWWGGVALEIFVLARGFRERLVSRFPGFYGYVAFVFLQGVLRFLAFQWRPQLYRDVYWITELLGMLVGCAVVFEIYRVALLRYPGTARMARNVLGLVFAIVLVKVAAGAASDPRWWQEASLHHIERSLRTIQAAAIVALVALFLFYAIPFGRNLRGILLGYGLFVGIRIVCLTFWPVGRNFWYYAYSAIYPVVLTLWLAHLWSYQPTMQQVNVGLEQDYQTIAAATRRRLQGARGYLAKAVRP